MITRVFFLFLPRLMTGHLACLMALFIIVGLGAPSAGRAEEVIVFVAGTGEDRSIMMVGTRGGEPVLLADWPGADTQPAVGPEGQLAWINHDGQSWDLIEDGRVVSRGGLHLSPAYAPDGTLGAARSGVESTDIHIFSPGKTRKLIDGQGGVAVSPAFSPDGEKIAYVSNPDGLPQIFVAAASGGPGILLTDPLVSGTDPVWSPTGEYLAYVGDETHIWLVDLASGQRSQLTREGINRRPSFAPNGRQIVFGATDEDGMSRLMIKKIDSGKEHILLPDFPQPQGMPFWTANIPRPIIKQGP